VGIDGGSVMVTPQSKGSFLPNDRLHKNSYTLCLASIRQIYRKKIIATLDTMAAVFGHLCLFRVV
ncbi:hypothetical protein EDE11_1171, partial [Methylomonas methanica]